MLLASAERSCLLCVHTQMPMGVSLSASILKHLLGAQTVGSAPAEWLCMVFVAGRPLAWRDLASFDYATYLSFTAMSQQPVRSRLCLSRLSWCFQA